MKMLRTALALSVFAACSAVAQQNPQNQAADPAAEQKKIRLEGKVFSASGEPLSRASVRLVPNAVANILTVARGPGVGGPGGPAITSSSDEEGKFVFENVPA